MNPDDLPDGTTIVPGAHYSGRNKIPNIHDFINKLDRDKKRRDAEIDEALKANTGNGEVKAHQNEMRNRNSKSRKTVRDPVTGKDVEIEDIDLDFKKAVDDPTVSVSGDNLVRP